MTSATVSILTYGPWTVTLHTSPLSLFSTSPSTPGSCILLLSLTPASYFFIVLMSLTPTPCYLLFLPPTSMSYSCLLLLPLTLDFYDCLLLLRLTPTSCQGRSLRNFLWLKPCTCVPAISYDLQNHCGSRGSRYGKRISGAQ